MGHLVYNVRYFVALINFSPLTITLYFWIKKHLFITTKSSQSISRRFNIFRLYLVGRVSTSWFILRHCQAKNIRSNLRWLVKANWNGFIRNWLSNIQGTTRYLTGSFEKNHENPQTVQSVNMSIFEAGVLRIQVNSCAAASADLCSAVEKIKVMECAVSKISKLKSMCAPV
jgi:hypothetical protein